MKCLLLLLTMIFFPTVWALDNPDAPDYVAEFKARIAPLETVIQEAMTTIDISAVYHTLEDALDKELNTAYQVLMQKQWLKFRDAEFSFLSKNFNKNDFGSSNVISIGSFRTSLIQARVEELLWYLKNYPQ